MFPKKHRLPGYLIPQVLQKGRWHRRKDFDLIISKPPAAAKGTQATPQLTVIIPQKLSKKAVRRKRTKRLFVEALHRFLPQIKGSPQIILMAKRILEKEKLPEIIPQVKESLVKNRLLEKCSKF